MGHLSACCNNWWGRRLCRSWSAGQQSVYVYFASAHILQRHLVGCCIYFLVHGEGYFRIGRVNVVRSKWFQRCRSFGSNHIFYDLRFSNRNACHRLVARLPHSRSKTLQARIDLVQRHHIADLRLVTHDQAVEGELAMATPTSTVSPSFTRPARISSASGSWMDFWITRFKGRAP